MTTKQDTIAINFTQEELDAIYYALNHSCCDLADKSETLKKVKEGTATVDDHLHPDYYCERWNFTGQLQNRIYQAQRALESRATDPFRTVLDAIFA